MGVNGMLVQLIVVSLTMTLALYLAWRQFGRERHVLFWSLSYGCCALQWSFNMAAMAFRSGPLYALTSLFLVMAIVLSVSASRIRVGRFKPWQAPVGCGAAAMIAGLSIQALFGPIAFGSVFLPTFASLMMGWTAAETLSSDRRTLAAEWTYAGVMAAFALFELVLAVTALPLIGEQPGTSRGWSYRALLVSGVPIFFVASGVAAILMIAGDLSTRLVRHALVDPLTGVFNRRGLEEIAEVILVNAHRTGKLVSLAVCEFDDFEELGERFGHAAGDLAIKSFANALVRSVRDGDVVGRIGNDRFVLIMPDLRAEHSAVVVARIQQGLAGLSLASAAGATLRSSFGIAMTGYGVDSLQALVGLADEALYQAKRSGENRVHIFGSRS